MIGSRWTSFLAMTLFVVGVGIARTASAQQKVDERTIYSDGRFRGVQMDANLIAYYDANNKLVGIGPDPLGRTRFRSLDVVRLAEKASEKLKLMGKDLQNTLGDNPKFAGMAETKQKLKQQLEQFRILAANNETPLADLRTTLEAGLITFAKLQGELADAVRQQMDAKDAGAHVPRESLTLASDMQGMFESLLLGVPSAGDAAAAPRASTPTIAGMPGAPTQVGVLQSQGYFGPVIYGPWGAAPYYYGQGGQAIGGGWAAGQGANFNNNYGRGGYGRFQGREFGAGQVPGGSVVGNAEVQFEGLGGAFSNVPGAVNGGLNNGGFNNNGGAQQQFVPSGGNAPIVPNNQQQFGTNPGSSRNGGGNGFRGK